MEIIGLFHFSYCLKRKIDARVYCFNSRYKLDFNVDRTKDNPFFSIFIKEDLTFIENFYGQNIENFNICVGENGSGKTRMLNDLIDIINNEESDEKQSKIIIIKKNEKFFYKKIVSKNFNFDCKIMKGNLFIEKFDKIECNKTILISNSIEPNHKMKKFINFIDFSITNKLKKNSYQNVKNETANNQIKFILNDIIKNSPDHISSRFGINTKAQFKNANFDNTYHEYFKSNSLSYKALVTKINEVTKKENNDNDDSILYELNRKFFLTQFFNEMTSDDYKESVTFRKYFFEMNSKTKNYNENNIVNLYYKYDDFLENILNGYEIDSNMNERYRKFIINLDNEVGLKQKEIEINIDRFNSIDKKLTEINREFISLNIFEDLVITWKSISSGENALLTIFSNLVEGIGSNVEDKKVLLLLDEIDIALHPDWQRIFLKNLFKFIETEFKSKKIQMILTTHSPLILSDVRKNDVNFLTKNNKRIDFKTFGANLNELMAESFFLENSLMGEFSEEIIRKLISDEYFEKNQTYSKEQVEGLISEVGENILRNHLLKKYDTKIRLTERINLLKKEIKRLENLEGNF